VAGWDPAETGYRTRDALSVDHDHERGEHDHDHSVDSDHDHDPSGLDPVNEAYIATLGPEEVEAFVTALHGTERVEIEAGAGLLLEVPIDGCLAEARAQIGGSGDAEAGAQFAALSTGFSLLHGDVLARVMSDPAYQDALESWQQCFGTAGYEHPDGRPFDDPNEALDTALSELWPELGSDGLDPDERQMAVTDLECQERAGLADAYEKAYLANEVDVIEAPETQALLLTWREEHDRAAETATDVLVSAGLISS
jgi:hypothetical protein